MCGFMAMILGFIGVINSLGGPDRQYIAIGYFITSALFAIAESIQNKNKDQE